MSDLVSVIKEMLCPKDTHLRLVALLIVLVCQCCSASGTNSTRGQRWVSQIVGEAMTDFAPDSDTNLECRVQGSLYRQHLANLTYWAVHMMDASGFNQGGILSGDQYGYGHYDQCVAISVPEINIKGKYCFVKLTFSRIDQDGNNKSIAEEDLGPLSFIWTKLERKKTNFARYRNTVYWAVCMPAGCSPGDLERSLSHLLTPRFRQNQMELHLSVQQDYCQEATNFYTKLTVPAIVVILILVLLGMLVLGSTLLHMYKTKESISKDEGNWFLDFSLINNMKTLVEENANEIQVMSHLKFLLAILFVYGHVYLLYVLVPAKNFIDIENGIIGWGLLRNSPVLVNMFLVCSGFITFKSNIKKRKHINVFKMVFNRWIRVTPVYLVFLLCWIYLFPLLTESPVFKMEGTQRLESCQRNLWAHLLFINNYYNDGPECLIVSWYLAVDMQLYVVAVLVGYVASKWRKLGISLLLLLLFLSALVPGLITYIHGYHLSYNLNTVQRYWETDTYLKTYIPTHMRASPYLTGMAGALLASKISEKFRVNRMYVYIGVLVEFFISYCCLEFYSFLTSVEGSLTYAIYMAFYKIILATGLLLVIFAGIFSDYGRRSLLSKSKIPTALNKLNLCILLVHLPVYFYNAYGQQSPVTYGAWSALSIFISCLFISYALSLLLYLFVQVPFMRICKRICS